MPETPNRLVSREGRVPVWRLHRVCVFCGSCSGQGTGYGEAARELGRELVSRGIRLVYGGGSTGLMGALADQVLALGGEVTGVIPEGLARKEVCHQGLSTTHVVRSMHERKARMHELADAFIALPGGYGTFEELLEAITWVQLGLSPKPVGVLNVKRLLRSATGADWERSCQRLHPDPLHQAAREGRPSFRFARPAGPAADPPIRSLAAAG